MFKWLLERPATLFGFVSGVLISVSTAALADFALAEQTPGNIGKLVRVAIISFVGAGGWFLLGEYLTALRRRVIQNQEGLAGTKEQTYSKALEVVARTERWKVLALLALSVLCSLCWPFL
jgi:hypothetical protein